MEYKDLCETITKEYAVKVLGWSINKTYNRDDGQELAQDIFYAVFTALSKNPAIENLDGYIWRIAHNTWCNRARKYQRDKVVIGYNDYSLLEMNYNENNVDIKVKEMIINNELSKMRKELANLNRLQRECMISYYIDGLSISDVAKRLNTTESTVKFHLFDARNKMKKELINMNNENQRIYRPGKLHVAFSGQFIGENPDILKVNESLIKQNICLLCYRKAKSIDEIAELTGIPKPYFETELEWLFENDFLIKVGKKFSTNFVIYGRRSRQLTSGVFYNTRNEYIDIIIDYLIENEQNIRDIGFYGCDLPYKRLLWPLIMFFSYLLQNVSPVYNQLLSKYEHPFRKDGGRYDPLGYDYSDNQTPDIDPSDFMPLDGWKSVNGVMIHSNFEGEKAFWIGIHDILNNENMDFIFNSPKGSEIISLFSNCMKENFDITTLTDHQREYHAIAIEKGWILKKDKQYCPQFPVFTSAQFDKLISIFKPFIYNIESLTEKLLNKMEKIQKDNTPSQIKDKSGFITTDLFGCIDFMTMMIAYEKGLLTVPEDPELKRIATLLIIGK